MKVQLYQDLLTINWNLLAAGKIIGEDLNPKRQAEVVEKIIEEAEDSSWKE